MIQTHAGSAVHDTRDRRDQNLMFEGVSEHIALRDSFDTVTTWRVGGPSDRELV